MTIAWDPLYTHSSITLSNGNLTASANGSAQGLTRATEGKTSGKWYWEIVIGATSNYQRAGITKTTVTNFNLGANTASWGYDSGSGNCYYYGGITVSGDTFGAGDIIGIALDADAGKMWVSKNGVWQAGGDPANGTNEAFSGIAGTLHAAFSKYYSNSQATARFKSSNFSYIPPSGFSAYYTPSETIALEDIRLNLHAAAWSREDLKTWLRAHDGLERENIALALQTGAFSLNDLMTALSACYQTQDDVKLFLETLGRSLSDLPLALQAYGRALSDLQLPLSTAGNHRSDLPMLLKAVSPTVFNDLALFLSATDGSALNDLRLQLNAIRQAPQYRSSIAQRLSSVISEVA